MGSIEQPRRRGTYPWRVFLVLWLGGIATSPLIVPYFLGLTRFASGSASGPPPPASAWRAALGSMASSAVVLLVAAGAGLWVARRIGLGAPYLEAWLHGRRREGLPPVRSIVAPALFWAVVTGLLAFSVDAVFVHALGVRFPAPEIHARIDVAWWRSGLASFWAPIYEETLDRLFLLSLVAWLLMAAFRVRSRGGEGGGSRGRTAALWTANLATALFFGWYHISNEALFGPVPHLVAVRTILIILPVGLAFGYLYWKRGLEAAILAHFAIDLLVHVVRPVVEGWLT